MELGQDRSRSRSDVPPRAAAAGRKIAAIPAISAIDQLIALPVMKERMATLGFKPVAGWLPLFYHSAMARWRSRGEHEPLAQFLLFVGWGWGQQRRSSACAITACTMLSHVLPRLGTN